MRTLLAALIILAGISHVPSLNEAGHARSDNTAPSKQNQKNPVPAPPVPSATPNERNSVSASDANKNQDSRVSISKLPPVSVDRDIIDYAALAISLGLLLIGYFGVRYAKRTLTQIAKQTTKLEEHATHFESLAKSAGDNAGAARDALELSRDTAKRQLRAYFGTPEGKINIRDDGSVEPRLTLINGGQTPAYELQVATYGRFETYPFRDPLPEQNSLPPHPHIVGAGRSYYFTGRSVYSGMERDALLTELVSGRLAFKLYGKCNYMDAFNDPHLLDFQLFIGGGATLQKTSDPREEWWFCFVTDSEGNSAD